MVNKFVMRMNYKGRRIKSGELRRYATSGVLKQETLIGAMKPLNDEQYIIFHPPGELFYGPSDEGDEDVAYIRVVSGKVNRGLPSYVTNHVSK